MNSCFRLFFLLFSVTVTSAAPVPYSGKVDINGVNFQGDAQFKFALRDANGAVHWRNADANLSINVPVHLGDYVVLLGGQGMTPLSSNLFLDHPELYLEVHFYRADTQEWLHMLPDQRITSAPHALAAEVANLANVAKAVEPGAITKSMLAAEVLADLNATVVIPQQDISIQTGSITRDMLSSGVRSDLNRTIVISRDMLPADVLADLNQTVDNASIASNANIAFSKLAISKADIIGLGIPAADTDTNLSEAAVDSMVANNGFLTAGSITRQMLPGDVLDDLNATVTRSRLAADVLADLDHSIASGSITRDMLAADVRTDLNASLSSASVTAANIHPDLVKYFLPEISNHPSTTSVLKGTGATLSSSASGKFLTYQWQKDGIDLLGETNATLVLTDVNGSWTGQYSLVASNDWGSVTTNAATFTVATNVPLITLEGNASVTHEAATSYTDAGATAIDALDGNLTAAIVVTGSVDENQTGQNQLKYNVFDAGGNAAVEKARTVTVVDTTAPVITLVGDANVSHGLNTAWNDPGATATDGLDGNLSAQISISGTVDVNQTGANVLTYSVSDAAGNSAISVSRTVNVVQPPSDPWSFTSAGAVSGTGPTQAQANAAYAGTSLENQVTINIQGVQEWTVPATGTYLVQLWGASGWSGNNAGGKGGYVQGNLSLSMNDTLFVYVGGQGTVSGPANTPSGGGWNGGGDGQSNNSSNSVGGGGGASDLRFGGTSLANRAIVAAGGGSSSNNSGATGGDGGGLTGDDASQYSNYHFGRGGTQSAGGDSGGALGQGGSATTNLTPWNGGGGGGWYGGGVSTAHSGGGGGSSYIGGVLNGSTQAGLNEGHGKVTITFISN